MASNELVTIRVGRLDGKKASIEAVRAMGFKIGFSASQLDELALVAAELAANLIHHAQGGDLIVSRVREDGLDGLLIESRDAGPGMADVQKALSDGYSTRGSLGYGLGTVNRLMDHLEIISSRAQPSGTKVMARKFLRPQTERISPALSSFGAATRPLPGSKINGDAVLIKSWETGALAAVVDGLGHGQFAHRASRKAIDYLENHYQQSLQNLFLGVGRECLATRGAVMALARFDWELATITFASIGNIEVKAFPVELDLPLRRGVLGRQAPSPLVVQRPWGPGQGLILHSDGLRNHWHWRDFPGLWQMPAQEAAVHLLRSLAKDNDDATVLVARGNSL